MLIQPVRATAKISRPAHRIIQVVSRPQKMKANPIARKKGQ
jgi:hypothetical protein